VEKSQNEPHLGTLLQKSRLVSFTKIHIWVEYCRVFSTGLEETPCENQLYRDSVGNIDYRLRRLAARKGKKKPEGEKLIFFLSKSTAILLQRK
jgi:hypothetical protein